MFPSVVDADDSAPLLEVLSELEVLGVLSLDVLELSVSELSVEDELLVILSLIPEIALLILFELESLAELVLSLLELVSFWAVICFLICLYSDEFVRTNVTVE